ncbi:MAG: phospholipase [Planctomycetes bacterium]|nr:phospholipase [Planctomycetota bacterium]
MLVALFALPLLQAPVLPAPESALVEPEIELVESVPLETTLDHVSIRDTDVVWREMIDGAKQSLSFAEFYVCDRPGSKLSPVLTAVERAAARGVRVRFLADAKFWAKYPETLEALAKHEHVEVRKLDFAEVAGGVLHAKYFVVDGTSAYLGSQNLDWRSLEHIQELGVRIAAPEVARVFATSFEEDWQSAGKQLGVKSLDAPARLATDATKRFPLELTAPGGTVRVTPLISPKEHALDAALWDLPRIVALIDGAQKSVRVQLLTYKPAQRNAPPWDELDGALRRAAARGVEVELLVADWGKRKGTIETLQELEPLEHFAVKLVTIPQCSTGYVPFARVVHAKYCVVDGERAWLGTSNWERDYFYESRNVGVLLEGAALGGALDGFFTDLWKSPYAFAVDPTATYEVPRFGE